MVRYAIWGLFPRRWTRVDKSCVPAVTLPAFWYWRGYVGVRPPNVPTEKVCKLYTRASASFFRSQNKSAYIITINAVTPFYKIAIEWQNTNIEEKYMNIRASGAIELRTFSHFHILKLLFLLIFCWYFCYFVSETCIGLTLKYQITSASVYPINAFSFYYNGIWRYVYKRPHTNKSLTFWKSMYASEWSEWA